MKLLRLEETLCSQENLLTALLCDPVYSLQPSLWLIRHFRPSLKRSLPHRLEAIPVKTPRRAIMPSSTSQPAPETRPLVFRRSIPTQPAAKTPLLVFFALQDNTIGKNNIALGYSAGIFTVGDNNINIARIINA
jgi:hypothetical protein